MNTRVLFFAAVFFVGCKAAETPEQMAAREAAEADSAKTAILAMDAEWSRLANAGQPDSIVPLFVPEGVMMPPDLPGAKGLDSIMVRMRQVTIPGGTLTITSQNISVHGPIAVDRGVYTYTAPAQGRNPALNLAGKYLAHLHKTDAGWRIAENIWNTDAPAPRLPPAR
jgi:ketosteroid isomerase-like protein